VRRGATRTAEGASTGADSISSTHGSESIGGRRAVAKVLEANLQDFLEREGIAFINERHKVTVGALMASRGGKMKSHKRGKSVDLGDRHRFDSGELGERLIKASNVLGKRSRGVILDGHALFETAHKVV
jgi:hypothetical protein